jgi:hypothetical protein
MQMTSKVEDTCAFQTLLFVSRNRRLFTAGSHVRASRALRRQRPQVRILSGAPMISRAYRFQTIEVDRPSYHIATNRVSNRCAVYTASLPLIERKALLEPLIAKAGGVQFNGHETGDGELIGKHACELGFEGVVSKTIDAPYAPGNRGLWRKSKCLNRQEFVVVGWTDPEGSRPHLGALLLGYYTDDGRLIYAGRVGTGMPDKVLGELGRRLDPLARTTSRSVRHRRARPASGRRSFFLACIGSSPNSSRRSPI